MAEQEWLVRAAEAAVQRQKVTKSVILGHSQDTVFELGQLLDSRAAAIASVPQGPHHVWMDLSPFLDVVGDVESECAMWRALRHTYGVLLVPGRLCGIERPGWCADDAPLPHVTGPRAGYMPPCPP
eukprot:8514437-Pyramimonas_sp.AAC.1